MDKELVYYIRKPNSQTIVSQKPVEGEKGMYLVKVSRGIPYAVVISNGYNSVGWAVCSHNDTFSKKKGLMIARLREKNGFSINHVPEFMKEHIDVMLEKSRRAFG